MVLLVARSKRSLRGCRWFDFRSRYWKRKCLRHRRRCRCRRSGRSDQRRHAKESGAVNAYGVYGRRTCKRYRLPPRGGLEVAGVGADSARTRTGRDAWSGVLGAGSAALAGNSLLMGGAGGILAAEASYGVDSILTSKCSGL